MHSSRKRTARLFTVSQQALCGGGCIPACTGQGGVRLAGGVSARGPLPRGCSRHPPVNGMSDRQV